MKNLIFLLVPLLFLSSCSIDWNDENEKKIAELEKQVTALKEKNDDEIFKKNMECSKKDLGDTSILNNHELFYSPSKKSCLGVLTVIKNENQPDEQVTGGIVDILTNEKILVLSYQNDKVMNFTNYDSGSLAELSVNEAKCIFNEKVKDLKQQNSGNYFQSAKNCP